MSDKKGLMIVLSAPSGAGKTTVSTLLLEKCPNLVRSISVTTRKMRIGEKAGVDYRFVTKSAFLRMVKFESFAEWARVHGNYYGTPKSFYRHIKSGKDVLFIIDVQGGMNIKKKYPESVLVFMMPPSLTELKKRILKRNTEQGKIIRERLINAKREMKFMIEYDYVIMNLKVKKTVQDIIAIINSEKLKTGRK